MAPFLALAATGNPWAAAFLLADDVAQVVRALSTQDPMDAAFAAFAVAGNMSALKNAGKYLRGLRHGKRGTQAAKSSPQAARRQLPIHASSDVPTGLCFTAGTQILTHNGFRSIESLRVGQRVATTESTPANLTEETEPETSNKHQESKQEDVSNPDSTEVTPDTWRLVRLKMPNPDGSEDVLELECLRPLDWVSATKAKVGSEIDFVLEEMGLEGPAEVISIEDCPPIEKGSGRVVLSTVTHLNGHVLQLWIEGGEKPLEPTNTHRFFSEDRQGWIPSGKLQFGERIRTLDGPRSIVRVSRKTGIHRVYNIEVETTHCYYVSDSRVLSHNETPCTPFEIALGYSDLYRFRGMYSNKVIRNAERKLRKGAHNVRMKPALKEFSNSTNSLPFMNWPNHLNPQNNPRRQWERIKNAMEEADTIHFNLAGFERGHRNIGNTLNRARGYSLGTHPYARMTEQELLLVLSNPAIRDKTTFYRGGRALSQNQAERYFGRYWAHWNHEHQEVWAAVSD